MSRLHAAVYDRLMARAEHAFLSDRRAAVLAQARGDVVEIGGGTGLNLPHYPAVDSLTIVEPDVHMGRRLAARLPRGVSLEVAHAEALPFGDASFDTVVSTLVLCTVADLDAAFAEIRRVLRPGGRLLFLEHVRSGSPRWARMQDRLDGLWGALFAGCHLNRETPTLLAEAGFEVDVEGSRTLPPRAGPVRDFVWGHAEMLPPPRI